MTDLTALTAQVAQDTTVESSAVTLINGLAAQIKALQTPAAVALAAQVQAAATSLVAAMKANTTK